MVRLSRRCAFALDISARATTCFIKWIDWAVNRAWLAITIGRDSEDSVQAFRFCIWKDSLQSYITAQLSLTERDQSSAMFEIDPNGQNI